MTTVLVNHTVADYAAWLPYFEGHGENRRSHGCSSEQVLQAADDPNNLTIILTFPSLEAGQGFVSDPSIKAAMADAGVTSAPDIRFLEAAPVGASA